MIDQALAYLVGYSDPTTGLWIWAWLLKGSLLLAVLFVLAALLRRAPSSGRHLLWTVGLATALAIPIAGVGIPRWELEIPASLSPALLAPATSTVTPAGLEGTGTAAGGSAVDTARDGAIGDAGRNGPTAGAGDTAREGTSALDGGTVTGLASAPVQSVAGSGGPTAGPGDPTESLPWTLGGVLRALLALWVVTALLLFLRLGLSLLRTHRLVARAETERDAAWTKSLMEISDRLGLTRAPKLVTSRSVRLPMTCGIVRPAIVLPFGASEWSQDRREAVLCHEIAHVRRRDLVWHLLGRVACALFWFNPMAWRAAVRLRAESERSCDDVVLSLGTPASAYADHLLQIATAGHASVVPAAALPMAQPGEFEARLLSILAPGSRRATLSAWQGTALAGLVLAFATPVIALSPATASRVAEASRLEPEASAPPEIAGLEVEDPADPDGGGSESLPEPSPGQDPRVDGSGDDASDPEGRSTDVATRSTDRTTQSPDGTTQSAERTTDSTDRATQEIEAAAERFAAGILNWLSVGLPRVLWPSSGQEPGVDAAVRDGLLTALADTDAEVRRLAAWALGSAEDSTTVRALATALATDPDAEVRQMSAWALAQQGRRNMVAEGLDALGSAVVQDEAADVRAMAAWALGNLDVQGTAAPLERALASDPDDEVRAMAAWALGQIEADSSREVLAAAIGAGPRQVSERAAWALGQIGEGPAPAGLIAALSHESADVRQVAAWALGQIEDPAAASALVDAIGDPDADVRAAALWALGRMDREPVAIEALTRALQDPNEEVRRAAARAFGGAGGGAWPWPRPMPRPLPNP